MILCITIPGIPQQQGSKTNYGRHGMKEANANLKPWRVVGMHAAAEARQAALLAELGRDVSDADGPVFTGPVSVVLAAYFPYRKGDYGTGRNSGVLKPDAPTWKQGKPDLDKLARACGDLLTQAGIVRDDSLIVQWSAFKQYGQPRTELTVCDAATGGLA